MKEIIRTRCRNLRKNQTEAEDIFWNKVRNRKFKGLKFQRQFPFVFEENKRKQFFIFDFYCHEYRLAIEIDGAIHKKQKGYDKMRTYTVYLSGIRVMRFQNYEIIQDIETVLQKIEAYLETNSPCSLRSRYPSCQERDNE